MALAEGDLPRSWEILSDATALPAVCGRVCPQETQCEGVCTVGKIKGKEPVAIGKLERFVADWKASQPEEPLTAPVQDKGKVAVVGSGAGGHTLARELAKMG